MIDELIWYLFHGGFVKVLVRGTVGVATITIPGCTEVLLMQDILVASQPRAEQWTAEHGPFVFMC
jgi:hypothetical protein